MTDPQDDRAPEPANRAAARVAGPRPLGAITDLADLLGGESPRSRTFLGGLVIGGLVGAAIAGSSMLRRRNRDGDRG